MTEGVVVANPFPEWLAEVAADAVVVRPDDIEAEARCNLWSFALTPKQTAFVTPADVELFASAVTESRRAWLIHHRVGPMILYWWHDEQAGQLRFSMVSVSHGRLPFGCEITPAPSIRAVASDWLGSPYLNGIPMDEFRLLGENDKQPDPPTTLLPVWAVALV